MNAVKKERRIVVRLSPKLYARVMAERTRRQRTARCGLSLTAVVESLVEDGLAKRGY